MNSNIFGKILYDINKFMINRTFIFYIALCSIIHGLARTHIIPNMTYSRISFGSDIIFGSIMLLFGTLALFASRKEFYLKIYSKIVFTFLAAAYAALGASIMKFNITGGLVSLAATLFLLFECMAVYDD